MCLTTLIARKQTLGVRTSVHLLLKVDVDDATSVDVHDANDDVAENTNSFGRFEQITPRQKRPET